MPALGKRKAAEDSRKAEEERNAHAEFDNAKLILATRQKQHSVGIFVPRKDLALTTQKFLACIITAEKTFKKLRIWSKKPGGKNQLFQPDPKKDADSLWNAWQHVVNRNYQELCIMFRGYLMSKDNAKKAQWTLEAFKTLEDSRFKARECHRVCILLNDIFDLVLRHLTETKLSPGPDGVTDECVKTMSWEEREVLKTWVKQDLFGTRNSARIAAGLVK